MKTSEQYFKLNRFIERLKVLGIEIKLIGNFPWVYLSQINGKRVVETHHSEHGFCIGYFPIQMGESFVFVGDMKPVFKLIKQYTNN